MKKHVARQKARTGLSQESILQAARTVFRAKGYGTATLEDVAAILGTTRPAIYYYFDSKLALLVEITESGLRQLTGSAKVIFDTDLPIVEKFRALLVNHIVYQAANADGAAIYFEERKELPRRLRDRVDAISRAYTDQLVSLYAAGVKAGHFVDIDPMVAVLTLFGAGSWTHQWFRQDGPLAPADLAEQMATLLMKGCCISSKISS
jgi:AcrR family transcriptional regulator